MPINQSIRDALDRDLFEALNSLEEYRGLQDMWTTLDHNQMLKLSPNYEIIIAEVVRLGREASDRYEAMVMNIFSALPMENPLDWLK